MDTSKIIIKISPPFLKRKIENNPGLRKIIDNINWLGAEKIIQLFIAIFVSALVARYLGPEQFGLMNYALAFVGLFMVFSTLGLDSIVVRNIVNDPDKKAQYLGSTLILRFIGSIILFIFSTIGIMLIRPDEPILHIFVPIIAIAYILQSFKAIDFWFQSQVKSKYTAQAQLISFLTVSLIKVILVITQQPLIAFILMFTLDSLIATVLLIIFYQKKGPISIFKWKVRLKTMKNLLSDSWPLILSGIAVAIYMKIDQIMIGNMLGDAELGIYSVAVKLSEAWYFLPMVITASVFPAILNARKKSRELYLKRMQKLYDGFVWFTISVALIVTLSASFIVNILYGKEYVMSSLVLSIHIWAGIFVFIGVANGKYLISENLTRIIFFRSFLGAFLNIFLNIFLIPIFGIIGAAISTLISYSFQGYFSLLLFNKSRILFFMSSRSFNIFRLLKSIKL